MFFKRNIPVDFPSARELRLTGSAAATAGRGAVADPADVGDGHDAGAVVARRPPFVEARPGWQDERAHGKSILPGFAGIECSACARPRCCRSRSQVRWGERRLPRHELLGAPRGDRPNGALGRHLGGGQPATYERGPRQRPCAAARDLAGEQNRPDRCRSSPGRRARRVGRPRAAAAPLQRIRRGETHDRAARASCCSLRPHAAGGRRRLSLPLRSRPSSAKELVTGQPVPSMARHSPSR